MHNYMSHFNLKWKNQFGGRKVARQATMFAHWAQKVGGQLHALPNSLRRQWMGPHSRSPHGTG